MSHSFDLNVLKSIPIDVDNPKVVRNGSSKHHDL